jgi:LEA14-like dessication related protein
MPKMSKELAKGLGLLIFLAATTLGQTGDPGRPTIELKRISVEEFDWAKRSANTRVTVEINNPGPAFTVSDVNYRLRLNDKIAGEGKNDKAIAVPANSTITVELPFAVDLSSLPDLAWSTISTGFKVNYEMEAEFTVPAVALLIPRIKASFSGELSPAAKVSTWTDKLRERLTKQ